MPQIASFWETILLGAQTYRGGAFRPHAELHMKVRLRSGHFERWLVLWRATVDELFEGDAGRAGQGPRAARRAGLPRAPGGDDGGAGLRRARRDPARAGSVTRSPAEPHRGGAARAARPAARTRPRRSRTRTRPCRRPRSAAAARPRSLTRSRIAVAAAAPNEPPTVRITVLMPVAMPTSDCGDRVDDQVGHRGERERDARRRAGCRRRTNSHGCEWANVLIRNETEISTAPSASSERKPIRAAIRAASGPASSWASAVGISSRPGLGHGEAEAVAGALRRLRELRA